MSALQQTFSITLLDDCVFSERAATEGMHDTLDCIPGSALLGAAAAQIYAQLTAEQAYAVFHSGRLRFGNGLPEVDDALAWPVPMSWHYAKNDKPQRGLFDHRKLHNFLHVGAIKSEKNQGEEQAKQLRDGYVTAAGLWVKPLQNYRMKTAINSETGRAADAQLFGYSALQRGQRFMASIEADSDFDPALFSRVTQVLQGQVLLGRSRSAEYGRVRIRQAGAASIQPQPGPSQGQTLTLWLISDLAPCDVHGQPTLALDPLALGLPEGSEIKWDKAFTRSRRYSPWNAKRHGFDAERQVLMAGGVLQVELPQGADAKEVAERLSQGIGLHREAGLGRVWVNPPLLATEHPVFASAPQVTDSKPASPPDHPLIRWLEQGAVSTDDVEERVGKMVEEYRAVIESARLAKGYTLEASDFYPSRTQWGSVLEAARSKRGSDLYASLFGGNGVIKPSGKGWDLEIPPTTGKDGWTKLADWLKARLPPSSQQTCDAPFVQQLARRLMDPPAKRKV
jgi:hypothetical protein